MYEVEQFYHTTISAYKSKVGGGGGGGGGGEGECYCCSLHK